MTNTQNATLLHLVEQLDAVKATAMGALEAAAIPDDREIEYRYAEVHEDGEMYSYGPEGEPDGSFETAAAAREACVEESDVVVARRAAGAWRILGDPSSMLAQSVPRATDLPNLVATAVTRADEWRRICGQPNYAENLQLALDLAATAVQEKTRADLLEQMLDELHGRGE